MDGYLAVGAGQLLVKPLSLADGRDHGSRSNEGRCALPEFEHHVGERLFRVREIYPRTAGPYGDVIAAEQGGSLVCKSGTSDVLQQRHEVNVGDFSLSKSLPTSEAGSEETRAGGLFGRLSHTQIRDLGEGGDQVREPQFGDSVLLTFCATRFPSQIVTRRSGLALGGYALGHCMVSVPRGLPLTIRNFGLWDPGRSDASFTRYRAGNSCSRPDGDADVRLLMCRSPA